MSKNKMTSHHRNHLLCFIAVTSFLIIFFSQATGQNQPVPEYWKLVLRWPAAFCGTPGFRCFKSILQKAFLIESVVRITRNSVVTCDVSKQPRVNGSEVYIYIYWLNVACCVDCWIKEIVRKILDKSWRRRLWMLAETMANLCFLFWHWSTFLFGRRFIA